MTSKTYKLCDLIAKTYTADEAKFFGFADRGNGAGHTPKMGRVVEYDSDAAQAYGDVVLTACQPIASDVDRVEFCYASEWLSSDQYPRYQYRILF